MMLNQHYINCVCLLGRYRYLPAFLEHGLDDRPCSQDFNHADEEKNTKDLFFRCSGMTECKLIIIKTGNFYLFFLPI